MELKSRKGKTPGTNYKARSGKLNRVSFLFVFISLFFVLSSCKVRYGLKGQTIPPEAKTISVETFKIGDDNASLMTPIEPQLLSQKLRDAVSSQTNLALTKQNGDLKFEECKVVGYSNGFISLGTTDGVKLNRLSVSISVDYVNSFDASKSFQKKIFTRYYDYDGSKTLSQGESEGLDQINRQLIEDLFNAAFNNW